jgi:hypothetical protein
VVGDWNGDGKVTLGVVNPANMTWYLRNENTPGGPDAGVFQFGAPGWKAVAGDWTGTGRAGIGAMSSIDGYWFLRNTPSSGSPDIGTFNYGLGAWTPLTGIWSLGQLQVAAGGVRGAGAAPLSEGQLQDVVAAALQRLSSDGVAATLVQRLASARYVVGQLPGADLGVTDVAMNQVTISLDAAGYGWFVDATPSQDEEFSPAPGGALTARAGSPAAGKMDLLTVVLHEMGHLAGLPDTSSGNDLMAETLATGQRRTQALDAIFSGKAPWNV